MENGKIGTNHNVGERTRCNTNRGRFKNNSNKNKTHGSFGPSEALNLSPETSAKLQPYLSRISPGRLWKQGHLVKVPKRENLALEQGSYSCLSPTMS